MRNILQLLTVALCLSGSNLAAQSLLHYWNFNTTSSHQAHLTPSVSTISGAAIDTFLYSGGSALVDVAGGTGQGFDLNNYNARNADAAGNHLRFNNPIYGALRFSLPTTGHKDIVVKYASIRSGSGAYYQFIHYTTDGSNYMLFDTIEPTTTPTLYTLDFSALNAVNNNANFKIRITFGQGGGGAAGNNRIDNFTLEGNVATPLSLIHYWNFNSTTSLAAHFTPNTSVVNGAAIDTFLYSGGSSLVDVAGGTGQGFDLNNFNARNSDVSGNHLRFNNPIYGALRFSLPTTGYKDVIVKYAGMRSGSGAYNQLIHYSTDGVNYVFFDTVKPATAPTLYTLDFSAITATDNNPNFKVRITFEQGAGGNAGNNRFDNFTLDGYSISGSDNTAPTVLFNPLNNTTDVALNINPTLTFNEDVRLLSNTALDNNNVDTLVELRLNDSAGIVIPFNASVSGRVITIVPNNTLASNQQYYLGLKASVIGDLSNNAITGKPSVKFTTIAPQTLFAAGDLVPVAYRMNATDGDDEVALLSLVDILPGTKINFTDAKFTTNTPAQCTGGLVWTAPLSGVAAGSVISIKNDGGIANIGILTGGNFGLSSGGDQLIVYTGTNTNPNYITALSSNAWLTSNTTCSGSNSMLPTGLTDGVSSIQFSTTKGNVAGNTTNAYYTGTQTGTPAQLRASILDTVNWSGVASGTPSQVWPAWSFPGPPVVVSASVINATTLRVIFSEDLDAVSATTGANFTGIANLASVTRSNNGSLADTLLLNYSTAFAGGSTNVLTISGVKDASNVAMIASYVFSFTYNTSLSFATAFASVKEDSASVNIRLTLSNPSVSSVRVVVKGAPYSTAASTDYVLTSHTLNFTGTSLSAQTINIPVINDAINEQDEYLVISFEDPSGLSLGAISTFTLFIRDNDRPAPAAQKKVELKYVGSFDPSPLTGSTTEIVVYDSASKRLIMTSAIQDRLDIADFSRPDSIVIV
ncbi:MAG: Ig-like domain-containing protein, partial [Bacteroidota bacterium]